MLISTMIRLSSYRGWKQTLEQGKSHGGLKMSLLLSAISLSICNSTVSNFAYYFEDILCFSHKTSVTSNTKHAFLHYLDLLTSNVCLDLEI